MQELPDQVAGDTKEILFTASRNAEDPNDWTDSTAQLILASDSPSGRSHIATIATFQALINTADQQQYAFTIEPATTEALTVPRSGLPLIADIEITAPGGDRYTAQAAWTLRPQAPTA